MINLNKYKKGEFGYWWTIRLGNSDIEDVIYDGDIYCNFKKLISLKGAPRIINGDFYCVGNKLTSLKGMPKIVNGNFSCANNKLISLEYAPEIIGGYFSCTHNKLTSLEHCPIIMYGYFYCNKNKIKNINEFKRIKFINNLDRILADFDNSKVIEVIKQNNPEYYY